MRPAATPPLVVLVAAHDPDLLAGAADLLADPAVLRVDAAPDALEPSAAACHAAVVLTDATLDDALRQRLTQRAPDAVLVPLAGLPAAARLALVHAALAQAARLAAVRREADDFTYALCHDLRSQLQGLVGLAGLLVEVEGERLSDEGRDWCRRIEATGESLARMAQDLLELARLGRQPHAPAPVPLAAIVAEAEAQLASSYPDAPPPVLTPAALPVVYADAPRLTAALLHLLRNAAQHDPGPGRGPTVTCHPGPGPDRVTLGVADYGPGVPAEARQRIFAPFHREANAPAPGAGLGLALVARVADRHGGRAWVEDTPDGGAHFRLDLPLAPR